MASKWSVCLSFCVCPIWRTRDCTVSKCTFLLNVISETLFVREIILSFSCWKGLKMWLLTDFWSLGDRKETVYNISPFAMFIVECSGWMGDHIRDRNSDWYPNGMFADFAFLREHSFISIAFCHGIGNNKCEQFMFVTLKQWSCVYSVHRRERKEEKRLNYPLSPCLSVCLSLPVWWPWN